MKHAPEVIQSWLDAINEDSDLTKWEQGFIESITQQFEERGTLSDRQEEILERIYAEKTR